ncbi:MAG: aldo/keto reductase [Terriglobia bacterium]|jgi:aryl-alcohol dehydrogenase-like predicted oxidoreductase
MDLKVTRRNLLKGFASMAAIPQLVKAAEEFRPPAGTMPTRVLGKTGVKVSILALGGVGAVTDFPSDELAAKFIQDAIASGITYVDTAAAYGHDNDPRSSERRYGKALGPRRKNIYLATKTAKRKSDEAMRDIETSLKTLHTDYLDAVQVHCVLTTDDIPAWGKPDGVYTLLRKLKDQKVIRFIGVTSHIEVPCLQRAVETYDFDTILTTFGPTLDRRPFEETLLPRLQEKKMGIAAMKVMGGMREYNRVNLDALPAKLVGEGKGLTSAEKLMRYTLSLPIHTATNGIGDYRQLSANLAVCHQFEPMTREERTDVQHAMKDSGNFLAFNQPGYTRA